MTRSLFQLCPSKQSKEYCVGTVFVSPQFRNEIQVFQHAKGTLFLTERPLENYLIVTFSTGGKGGHATAFCNYLNLLRKISEGIFMKSISLFLSYKLS